MSNEVYVSLWQIILFCFSLLFLMNATDWRENVILSFSQKYAFFSRSCRLKPPKDLEKTRYIQSYVNLLSKALYWWITDVLVLGYKRPLSLSDLGELPKVSSDMWNMCVSGGRGVWEEGKEGGEMHVCTYIYVYVCVMFVTYVYVCVRFITYIFFFSFKSLSGGDFFGVHVKVMLVGWDSIILLILWYFVFFL